MPPVDQYYKNEVTQVAGVLFPDGTLQTSAASGGSLPQITGGNTNGGVLLNTTADWSGLLPPGNPSNLGINLWSKGQGDRDTYCLFQAGNTVEHRSYLGFLDKSGTYRWLIGKNANNEGIYYDAINDIHRMYFQVAAGGGASFINSSGPYAVTVNFGSPVDAIGGTGGFVVYGNNVSAAPQKVFEVTDSSTSFFHQGNTNAPGISGGAAVTIAGKSSSTPLYVYINAAASTEPNLIQLSTSTGSLGLIFADHAAGSGNVDGVGWSANGQHAFYVNGGFTTPALVMKTDNTIQFGKALVALGGGAAPTLGTIGGSGPATAAQNTWMQFKDSAGNNFWVPVWK